MLKMGSQKPPKIAKSCKKSVLKRTHDQGLEGVKPLNLMTLTHFQLFLKRPRAPKKVSKWKPKWSLWALKITKIQKREHSKKTAKPRP